MLCVPPNSDGHRKWLLPSEDITLRLEFATLDIGVGGQKTDKPPTLSEQIKALKKELKDVTKEIPTLKAAISTLEQSLLLPGLADDLVASKRAELAQNRLVLETKVARKEALDGEIPVLETQKANEVAEAKRLREEKAAATAAAKQGRDAQALAAKLDQFLTTWPGATEDDFKKYDSLLKQQEEEKLTFLNLNNTEETWELYQGIRDKAQEKVRKNYLKNEKPETENVSDELFGDGWTRYRQGEIYLIFEIKEMIKLLEVQEKRLETAAQSFEEEIARLLGLVVPDPKQTEKLQKQQRLKQTADWNKLNVLPEVTQEIAKLTRIITDQEQKTQAREALQKFLVEYSKASPKPEDFPAVRDLEAARKREETEALKSMPKGRWMLATGNRYLAEEAVRKVQTSREDAFENWEEVVEEQSDSVDAEERKILTAQINSLTATVKRKKKDLDEEKAKPDSERNEGLVARYTAAYSTAEKAANLILPDLKAKLDVFNTARSEAAEEARQARINAATEAREAKKAEKDAARAEREAAVEEERSKKEEERQSAKALRVAEAEAIRAERAAAQLQRQEDREAAEAEVRRKREEATRLRKENNRAKAEAKKAVREAAAQKRKERLDAEIEAIQDKSEEKPARIAAAMLILEKDREQLQQELDAAALKGEFQKEAKQPIKRRGAVDRWPVCQIPLSIDQMNALFLVRSEIFPEQDDAFSVEGSTPSSVSPLSPVTPLPPPEGQPDQFEVAGDEDVVMGEAQELATGVQLSDVQILKADPMAFNWPYAKKLLLEHLEALEVMYNQARETNPKAKYVNVYSSLGTDKNAAVDTLLPQWEHMLRYRNTMLMAKKLQLDQDLELIAALDKGREAEVGKELGALVKLGVNDEFARRWTVEARRMLESDRGQLPGQLFSPQPYFMPMRIAAPPRVGKSASALLLASLAKRAGMVTLYSVSPNKNTPVAEMQTKLVRIGWNDDGEARKVDTKISETYADYKENAKCMRMQYSHFVIDDVPGKSPAAPDYSKIDMVLYSSDVLEDCQRAGAVLANWRRRAVVVFHIRDEAQSLAKALKNNTVTAQKVDIPPPVELQYLRYYYGNPYGLNCNVTATHFPTLLEEKMWGFFGSVTQNANAGLSLTADKSRISAQIGSKFLPSILPAIRPYVSPGYIGVDALRVWQEGLKDVVIEVGASHSGTVGKKNLELMNIDLTKLNPETKARVKAKQKAVVLRASTRTSDRLRRAQDGGLTREEQAEQVEQAVADANLTPLEVLAGGKKDDDSDYKPDSDDSDDDSPAPSSGVGGKRKAKGPNAKEKLAQEKAAIEAARKRDFTSIQSHFAEWLNQGSGTLDSFRSLAQKRSLAATEAEARTKAEAIMDDDERGLAFERIERIAAQENDTLMIPMYIGALNQDISGAGMASFIRTFSTMAHARAVAGKVLNKNYARSSKAWSAAQTKYGVAFVLFTTAITNLQQLQDSRIKVSDETIEPPKIGGTSFPDDDEEDEDVPMTARPTPCEPIPKGKKMSALVAVYEPMDPKNQGLAAGETPFVDIFFTATADGAIEEALNAYDITKVAILGYGMLQAGLTVQSVVANPNEPLRIFCPQYMALGSAKDTNLDGQLQIAGRTFVELKDVVAPDEWFIKMLGVDGIVDTLKQYSEMERLLAEIEGQRLYESLKSKFGADIMTENEFGGLGVVGTRRGDFGSILGLTPKVAAERAKAAESLRAKRVKGVVVDKDEELKLLDEAQAAAEATAAKDGASNNAEASGSGTTPPELE